MNSCLGVREISSDLSTEISSKDNPPKKKFSPETQYSCLLQGDGPISSDLNAATHSQKTKQTKKKTPQPKDPPETHPSEWWYTIVECTFGLHTNLKKVKRG
jgi:hypothetical protein